MARKRLTITASSAGAQAACVAAGCRKHIDDLPNALQHGEQRFRGEKRRLDWKQIIVGRGECAYREQVERARRVDEDIVPLRRQTRECALDEQISPGPLSDRRFETSERKT